MAPLQVLALRFQQLLDGLDGETWSPAAGAACLALDAAMEPLGQSKNWDALHPIILRTDLAVSIVAIWERISWAALTRGCCAVQKGPL